MVIKMKKTLMIILSAILIGGGMAYLIFNKTVIKDNNNDEYVATAFQIGAFTNYDNAIRIAERNNGIVVSDGDIFRVYVAVLYDDRAIKRLESYYDNIGLNYYLKEVLVTDDFVNSISSSEEMLISSSVDTYSVINLNVLNKYKELL